MQNLDLGQIPNWNLVAEKTTITRTFEFKSYLKNLSFINAVAYYANKLNHHPEICFSFNQCKIDITTHDVQKLTEKDLLLAIEIDRLFT